MIEILKSYSEALKIFLYGLFAILNLNLDIVHIIMWMMLIDTVTGIVKVIRLKELKFTFTGFYMGLMTKFIVLLIPMTLALMALGLGYDFKWAVDSTLRLIILSEGISIFTNILSAKDNKKYQNKDYLSVLLHWVRNKLIAIYDTTIKERNK